MARNDTYVRKLATLIKRWGGELVRARNLKDFPSHKKSFSEAPFSTSRRSIGVFWADKQIIYIGSIKPVDLIHEMGHVFACKNRPKDSEDFSFFAWEVAVAKSIGIPVKKWWSLNGGYWVDFEDKLEASDLSKDQRKRLLKGRQAVAKKAGLFTRTGKPRTIR